MKAIFSKSWYVLFIHPNGSRTQKEFDFYQDAIEYFNAYPYSVKIKIYKVNDKRTKIKLHSERQK